MAPSTTPRKPRPLPQPKASEAIAVYGGLPSGACAARLQMTARERAQVDRALALVGRQLRQPGEALSNPQCSKDYFRLAIGAEPVEHFCALWLDSQHRALAFERLAQGTLTQTSVYPARAGAFGPSPQRCSRGAGAQPPQRQHGTQPGR
jgi:DNA repair protein RadC